MAGARQAHDQGNCWPDSCVFCWAEMAEDKELGWTDEAEGREDARADSQPDEGGDHEHQRDPG